MLLKTSQKKVRGSLYYSIEIDLSSLSPSLFSSPFGKGINIYIPKKIYINIFLSKRIAKR
jgi:hypothetical protein